MSGRLVSCCMCGVSLLLSMQTVRGATYVELAARARISQACATQAGASLMVPATQPDEFPFGSGYPESGGVLFYPDMNNVLLDKPPTTSDVLRRPWLLLAQGQTDVVVVAAYTIRQADSVTMRAQVLDKDNQPVDTVGLVVRPVVFAPVAQPGQKAYRMQGLWLSEPGPVQAASDHVVAWALRVEAGPHAKCGEYRVTYRISWENEDPTTAPRDTLRLTILPVALPDPADRPYTFGAFCARVDLSEPQQRQMREHGINAVGTASGDMAAMPVSDHMDAESSCIYGPVTASMGYGQCRARFGLSRYVRGAKGSWFWSYNEYVEDPWNEFDGQVPDSASVICWPPLHEDEPSVASLGYEGLRAGVNDVRYAMALEDAIKTGKGPDIERIGKQYTAWRQQARQGDFTPEKAEAARLQIIGWILEGKGLPLPKNLEKARAAASQPASTQPAGFAPVQNEQE
jgi:hypothetical protein